MELVADTNIAISAILRPGMSRSLILYPGFKLFSPQQLVEELENNKEELIAKSTVTDEEYHNIVRIVLSNITIVPESDYGAFKDEAEVVSPDWKDRAFFAVALQRNCAIWSNEKRLKNQKKVEVYNTQELLGLLQMR